jgi:uncharacterized protein (TIGR02145 family)
MNFFTFTKLGRTLAVAAVLAVGVAAVGCGGGDNPSGGDNYNGGSNNNGGNNNNGGSNNNGGNNNNGGGGSDYVTLGGLKWMTTNLNVATADSWCYGEGGQVYVDGELKTLSSSEVQANCAKYGRLYTWESAKAACLSVGKRLPTREEWEALVTAAGGASTAGKKLKSTSGWNDYNGQSGNGTNDYGFSALPGGLRGSSVFDNAGNFGLWWTATELGSGLAYGRGMRYDYDFVVENFNLKSNGQSVRCLED